MTRAELQRVKNSLERERLRLKAEAILLEKRQRAAGQERDEAIAFLRIFCDRYGDNAWSVETPLVEIIRDHLAIPLNLRVDELLQRLSELQQAARRVDHQDAMVVEATSSDPGDASAQTIVRATRRALAVSRPRHSTLTVRAEDRRTRQVGHRSTCICSWRSPIVPTAAEAGRIGDDHCRPATHTTEGVRHHA